MKAQYTTALVAADQQRQSVLAADMESRFADGVAIYGAGFLGTWACGYLRSLGAKVAKFIDRDPAKAGTYIDGVPVVPCTSEELAGAPAVFIAARHAIAEVDRALAPFGVTRMSFDAYYVVRNFARLQVVRDTLLSDERSVTVFNALLSSMLNASVEPCLGVMEKDMYFCLPQFAGNFDEAFVDAGAFVGDTVERFIWENLGTFRHIHAFEPGYRQFQALERRMVRLASEWAFDVDRVSLVRAGLSDRPGRMACTFVNDFPLRHGLAVAQACDQAADVRSSAEVLTLDAYLGCRPVSFIKADVEGMEMELLRGAERTIRACKPKMALCVYHYPSHLCEVAEYVRKLVPEYQFSLRLHAPLFGDFVLYCWT